jgi:Fic-DOC domain mobile mystery protein B
MLGGDPIHGQTPLDDISGLRDRSIRTRTDLNAAEALNIRKAVVKYLLRRPGRRAAPFDPPWLLRLHAEMFGDVWSWAGLLRTRELNIGPPPHEIGTRLVQLLGDLTAWGEFSMPRDEQAARLHHGAVLIHPFLNGNGRWARMVANIWLRLNGSPVVEWPEETVGSASVIRDEYLAAVRKADRGDVGPLLTLHRRFASRGPG